MIRAATLACATCIASPFGDRTYNWPYLMLILLPFVVAAVIGGVLAHVNGVIPRLGGSGRAFEHGAPQPEDPKPLSPPLRARSESGPSAPERHKETT
ncbi:MAG: hypothetical protein FJZ38_02520 [Candidatus Rokubacteria bacterium]|nr:hypothetical protein [Candidatus Rokubacteria bacterium]